MWNILEQEHGMIALSHTWNRILFITNTPTQHENKNFHQFCGAGARSRKKKLPPRATAGIMNYGPGSGLRSLTIFFKNLKKFYREESWLLKNPKIDTGSSFNFNFFVLIIFPVNMTCSCGWYGLAVSLAYPSGKVGRNFLVQMISTCLPSRRGRGVGVGVGTLWLSDNFLDKKYYNS